LNFPLVSEPSAKVGNLYGWALGFLPEGKEGEKPSFILSSDDYYAKITASLPTALNGGRFTIILEALGDDHYRDISACKAAALYLYWRDINSSFLGYGANVTGLIGLGSGPTAESLRPAFVTNFAYTVTRRSGAKTLETTLEGRDNAFDRLSRARAPQACFKNMAAALSALAREAGVEIVPEPSAQTLLGQALEEADERTDAAAVGQTCAGALETIAKRIAAGSLVNPTIPPLREDAPSVVLFRGGSVHVGRRPIPFPAGSTPKTLSPDNGLVEVGKQANADESALKGWNLICLGRPDLQIGDVVTFETPPEDERKQAPGLGAAVLGSLIGAAAGLAGVALAPGKTVLAVVAGVVHTLSSGSGFTTQVTCLEYPKDPQSPWAPFHSSPEQKRPQRPGAAPDPAAAVARKVRDLAHAALGLLRFPAVAEVRSAATKGTSVEPPAGTVTVWEGVGGETAQASASRRLPIQRKRPVERQAVATVTPFAWGRCGLALPRYPGMRVMLNFAGGNAHDAVEIGSLWGPGERMESEPGDWWLKLPINQSTASLSDTNDHLPSGQVVNDLTDKSGTRVIEVGKLTVRVGTPPDISSRPKHKASAAVSIEHSDGQASITIDQGGKIKITGLSIELDAGAGNIKIAAANVDVAVTGQMKVS